ncbi:MAG: RNase adapter RapZ [Patescibacteria group bacterium]
MSKILHVHVCSFSFIKRGYPVDESEHGGGFVFDCRAMPNPGRHDEYKLLTGLDDEVIVYMARHSVCQHFISNVMNLLHSVIVRYHEEGYEYLSIAFGCTGGQHRSVYFAEQLVVMINLYFSSIVEVHLRHLEQERWPTP